MFHLEFETESGPGTNVDIKVKRPGDSIFDMALKPEEKGVQELVLKEVVNGNRRDEERNILKRWQRERITTFRKELKNDFRIRF